MKDNLYYKAALAHFEAKAEEARAVLDTYFNNSVGIGDHPNIVDEVVKLVEELSHCEECIELCDNLLKQNKKA